MVRQYFDMAEAEATLPRLTALLRQAQALKERLERYERISLKQRIMTDGSEAAYPSDLDDLADSHTHQLQEDFYAVIESIEKLGAVIKDLDQGLVGFYTKFEGRDVFLSWRLGEPRIRYWHEVDEDATGRKRIIDLDCMDCDDD